jgi:hypothetical protein
MDRSGKGTAFAPSFQKSNSNGGSFKSKGSKKFF